MSTNTLVTPTDVARDAAVVLYNRMKTANLVSRDKEARFMGTKVGDSIKVTVPPAVSDASEFTGSTVASDITETEIDLTLDKHYYKRVDLTTKQKSFELSEFTRLITAPFMGGIASSIDKYVNSQLQVFRAQLAGTVTNRPSSMAHIAAAHKVMQDNFILEEMRIGLLDTTVEESFSQLAQFQNRDFGEDGPMALRNAMLGRRYGFDWVVNPNLDVFVRSADPDDITGTVLTNGTPAIGATVVPIDGITNATGTIFAGAVFTLAGDSTRYVVRKDATIASNAVSLTVFPALVAAPGDGAAVTFEAAGFSNLVFHPNAATVAIVAPEPLSGGNSVIATHQGVSVRVSQDSSITSLSDSMVIDVFCGARVIQPDGGALIAG